MGHILLKVKFYLYFCRRPFYIRFDDVIDWPILYTLAERSERLMTVAFRTESVGVSYEVLLVYRFEYSHKSGLDKLVFKTWYPQGALFVAARLGYVLTPDRLRSVCHPVQPLCQV